jgi:hypothetical protein
LFEKPGFGVSTPRTSPRRRGQAEKLLDCGISGRPNACTRLGDQDWIGRHRKLGVQVGCDPIQNGFSEWSCGVPSASRKQLAVERMRTIPVLYGSHSRLVAGPKCGRSRSRDRSRRRPATGQAPHIQDLTRHLEGLGRASHAARRVRVIELPSRPPCAIAQKCRVVVRVKCWPSAIVPSSRHLSTWYAAGKILQVFVECGVAAAPTQTHGSNCASGTNPAQCAFPFSGVHSPVCASQ